MSAVFPHQNLERIRDRKWRRIATAVLAAFGLLLIFNVISFYIPVQTWPEVVGSIDPQFWMFVGVGFAAQLADGMLGMVSPGCGDFEPLLGCLYPGF